MNKKFWLIIIISLIILIIFSASLYLFFRGRGGVDMNEQILTTSENYLENYGTVIPGLSDETYYASFKDYISTNLKEKWEAGLKDSDSDEETRKAEQRNEYTVKTTVIKQEVSYLSDNNKEAEVTARVQVETSAKYLIKPEIDEKTYTVVLIKENNKWVVDKTE